MNKIFNLDTNASLAILPEVIEVVKSFSFNCSNPSSIHSLGQNSKALIELSRTNIKKFLNCNNARIVFTSGATEANNQVVSSFFFNSNNNSNFVTSNAEHLSILNPFLQIQKKSADIRVIDVDSSGYINISKLLNSIDENTKLVSLILANNEIGTINNIQSIVELIKSKNKNCLVHTDAVQAIGKLKVDFDDLGIDLMTISGHKFGALTGIGALIIKKGVTLNPFLLGGSQEHNLRAGTENIIGIVSIGEAAKVLHNRLEKRINSLIKIRESFISKMNQLKIDCSFNVNYKQVNHLPNTISVKFKGVKAADLLVALDLEGIYVSAGSACSSGKPIVSHVLSAIGLTNKEANETIRISFNDDLSTDDIDYILEKFNKLLIQIKEENEYRES